MKVKKEMIYKAKRLKRKKRKKENDNYVMK